MRILLVEDHVELSHWVSKALRDANFTVECAATGADADALLHTQDYALVILDLTLPRMDGLEVLRRLRARGGTPVLILTARGGLEEKVQGLNLGADDYLAKPFELAELEARVKALLRRRFGNGGGTEALVHRCGQLSFDTVSRMFHYCGEPLGLTPREHAVLEALIARPGRALSKEKLFDEVFALVDDANLDAIELYIHRIRKKLERQPEGNTAIVTLRGIGYLLQERPT